MDANILQTLGDLGTAGILLYVLINVLAAYHAANTRTLDLLENMIDDIDPEKTLSKN